MPRYIDAEKIEIRVERSINADGLIFIPMRDVHASIDRTPEADVAPKSEFDDLQKELASIIRDQKTIKRLSINDFARQILETIKAMRDGTIKANKDTFFSSGRIRTLDELEYFITALLKDYEGEVKSHVNGD